MVSTDAVKERIKKNTTWSDEQVNAAASMFEQTVRTAMEMRTFGVKGGKSALGGPATNSRREQRRQRASGDRSVVNANPTKKSKIVRITYEAEGKENTMIAPKRNTKRPAKLASRANGDRLSLVPTNMEYTAEVLIPLLTESRAKPENKGAKLVQTVQQLIKQKCVPVGKTVLYDRCKHYKHYLKHGCERSRAKALEAWNGRGCKQIASEADLIQFVCNNYEACKGNTVYPDSFAAFMDRKRRKKREEMGFADDGKGCHHSTIRLAWLQALQLKNTKLVQAQPKT